MEKEFKKEMKKKLTSELKELKKMSDNKLLDYIDSRAIYYDYILDDNCNKIGVNFRLHYDYEKSYSIWCNTEFMELEAHYKREIVDTLPLGRELGQKVKLYAKHVFNLGEVA